LNPNKTLYHLFALLSSKNEAISRPHFIILCVPPLHITPSPCPDVVITPIDEVLYAEFKQIFEPQPESFPLRYFARDPAEIPTTIVLENRSEKAITGLSYRWRKLDRSGKVRNQTVSSDSHRVDISRRRSARTNSNSMIAGQDLFSFC
jgi:hypothetical protein